MGWPASKFAILGGILLLAAGASGSATFFVGAITLGADYFPDFLRPALAALASVLRFVAALGGISVVVGGFLAARHAPRLLCSILITLGAGVGLVGFAFHVAMLLAQGQGLFPILAGFAAGLAGIGALLALIAQIKLIASGVG